VETCFRAIKGHLRPGAPERPHSFGPPRQSPPADTPRGALRQGIEPHRPPYVPWMTLPRRRAPVKPICETRLPPIVASATQDNPRPGCREPGLSPSKGGKQEVPGSARTRVRERRSRSRLQARRVHCLADRSRKHALCGAGTRPRARVGKARAGGTCHPSLRQAVHRRSRHRPWRLGAPLGAAGADRPTTTGVALSLPLRHLVATGDDVNRRSPRRAGSSAKAAGVHQTVPVEPQSRLLLSAETSTLRRAARPAAERSLGRSAPARRAANRT
jgi:hypothetical protein